MFVSIEILLFDSKVYRFLLDNLHWNLIVNFLEIWKIKSHFSQPNLIFIALQARQQWPTFQHLAFCDILWNQLRASSVFHRSNPSRWLWYSCFLLGCIPLHMRCLKISRFLLWVIIGGNLERYWSCNSFECICWSWIQHACCTLNLVTCLLNVISSVDSDLCLLGWCRWVQQVIGFYGRLKLQVLYPYQEKEIFHQIR